MGGQVHGSPDRDVRGLTSGGGGGGGNVFVTNTNTDPIPVSVTNEITLDAATLAALETITVNQGTSPWVVSGTVSVNEPVTVDGTVDVGNFPSSFEISNDVGNPIPISGTVSVNEPVTVDGTVALDATTLAALETITVNQGTSPWVVSGTVSVNEPVTVDATDLDIRDLAFATDSVDVSGSEVSLDAATLTALETITVNQGTSPWVVSGTVSVNEPVTVDATDLDIRDLAFATDSVDVSGSEVSLDSATLTALETITVNQGTSPWVVSGTVSVNEPVSVDDNGGSLTVDNLVLTDVHDDPNDAIRVNIVAGASGGVSATDDSAFAVGTDDVVPMGALFDDTSTDSVDEGDVGIPRMTADRRLMVDGPLTDTELRAADVDVNVTNASLAVTLSEPISVDDNGGSLTVDGTVTVGTLPAFDSNQGIYAEDSVHSSGALGHFILGLAGTGNTGLSAFGDYTPILVDDRGSIANAPRSDQTTHIASVMSGSSPLRSSSIIETGHITFFSAAGAAMADAQVKVAHLDMTTATTTTIVAAVTNKKIRVFEYSLSSTEPATATDINFARGAGTTRVTGSPIHRLTTGQVNVSRLAPTGMFLFETAASENLRVTQSAAADISIAVVYAEVD